MSDSESESTTALSSTSGSDKESSKSDPRTLSGKRKSKDRNKGITKVKEEMEDFKKVTKLIHEALGVIKVNLTKNWKPRRTGASLSCERRVESDEQSFGEW